MIFTFIASLGYFISVLLLHRVEKPAMVVLLPVMCIAFIAHTIQVLTALHGVMNDVSVMNVLAVVTLCMALIGSLRYFLEKDRTAYTVVALIATICVWFPIWFPTPSTSVNSWSLKFHIVLSIAAYIAIGFAALYACFLLIQDTRLRKGKDIFSLNLPLNYIERTMMSFTVFGEILLTLSLATGAFFIHDILEQHLAHKGFFGAISWLIIAVLLFRHYRQGFRGRQAAIWLLSGFVFLALAYFGSAFVLQIILHKV
ncbi:MAG: cytochrome C assembly family protein [Ostreibacterium sp.]